METLSLAILFGLFITMFALRIAGERRFSKLSAAQKVAILDGTRDIRVWSSAAFLVVLALILLPLLIGGLNRIIADLGLVAIVVVAAATAVVTQRRLSRLGAPVGYQRYVYLRYSVMVVGVIGYAVTLLVG